MYIYIYIHIYEINLQTAAVLLFESSSAQLRSNETRRSDVIPFAECATFSWHHLMIITAISLFLANNAGCFISSLMLWQISEFDHQFSVSYIYLHMDRNAVLLAEDSFFF